MTLENMEMDEDFVKICYREGSEFMEFPIEQDGTLLLSTVQAQFPDAIGLKYRGSSGAWRAIREAENVLHPPKIGWGLIVYCLTVSDTNKRRYDDTFRSDVKEHKGHQINPLLQDMAVMGLPYKTTDQQLKDYFETNFGELAYSEVKHDQSTGKSRGFGFIRFKDEAAAKDAVNAEHYIDGRKVDVRMKKHKPMKMFIGRLPHGTTTGELENYFSKYGELTDTYIPTPFRNFAFITFASSEAAKTCMKDRHILGGSCINVMERNPRDKDKLANERVQQEYGNNSNPSCSGGFGNSQTRYNPKEVQNNYMDYSSAQGKSNSDADLKQMLFQFLTNQK